MAENPATWGRAERVVRDVLHDHRQNAECPPGEQVIGLSLVRQITDALREASLLVEDNAWMRLAQDLQRENLQLQDEITALRDQVWDLRSSR